MKAWKVSINPIYDCNCNDIVFAETTGKAKQKLLNGKTIFDSSIANDPDLEFVDVRAVRVPKLDGWENESPMKVMERCILKCNWYCTLEEDGQEWTSDNFNKEKFEKEWASLHGSH